MKTILSIIVLAFFILAATGSESSSIVSKGSSYGSDAYSTPSQPHSETCAACGGRGYIIRDGVKETCVCGGTGKATPFPEK